MMISVQFSSYPIYLAQHLFESDILPHLCRAQTKRLVMITDTDVLALHAVVLQTLLQQQGLHVEILSFSSGEQFKTRQTKAQLEDQLLNKQYGRDTCILAVGGGLVTDLVGFLAATYCRGLPVIYIPTTLLAMVDACMGGKTGVNTSRGKNLIGTFTQPHAVCIDVSTLQTLPDREWRNGIVEMIKHGLIADAALFQHLQASPTLKSLQARTDLLDLIHQNCVIKKTIVEQDEHEQGLRQLLNFGHTIGHAIELLEDYQIGHGEAVAIGLLVEGYLAMLGGHLSPQVLHQIKEILQQYDLPLQTNVFDNKATFIQALSLDKKSVQAIPRFVLLTGIGTTYTHANHYAHHVDLQHVHQALDWAALQFTNKDR